MDMQGCQRVGPGESRAALSSVRERQAALREGFASWQPRTLDQMLDTLTERYGDRPYVMTDTRIWRYRDIQAWSLRLAAGLLQEGVRPGDHVALVMANYPEFVALKYAISRVGAVAVPLNYLNRRDELAYVLNQSDAVLLVTMDRFRDLDYLGMLDELVPGWEQKGGDRVFGKLKRIVVFPTGEQTTRPTAMGLDQLNVPDLERLSSLGPVGEPQAVSDILYTSGTTGSPKGVMLTHDMVLRTAFGSAHSRAFEDGRRILFSLPMYHVFGYMEGMLAVLFSGGAIVPRLKFDADDTLRAVERHGVSDLLLIPTMTLALIDEAREGTHDLRSLQSVISSGGRAPASIWSDIQRYLGPVEITTGYGMTEVTATSLVTRPDDPVERLKTNGRERDVGPAGRLVEYRVIDPGTGVTVEPGEVGELLARGPGVTPGYYNKPEATADAFTADGWLKTGDLGRMDAEGYLTLVGRTKESYRCGGEQVLPSEIEDVLATFPGVKLALVVPVPDARMGEVGTAFIVPQAGQQIDPEALIDFCRERLARFKVPKHVLCVEEEDIPVTPSGRPRRFLMAQQACEKLGL